MSFAFFWILTTKSDQSTYCRSATRIDCFKTTSVVRVRPKFSHNVSEVLARPKFTGFFIFIGLCVYEGFQAFQFERNCVVKIFRVVVSLNEWEFRYRPPMRNLFSIWLRDIMPWTRYGKRRLIPITPSYRHTQPTLPPKLIERQLEPLNGIIIFLWALLCFAFPLGYLAMVRISLCVIPHIFAPSYSLTLSTQMYTIYVSFRFRFCRTQFVQWVVRIVQNPLLVLLDQAR